MYRWYRYYIENVLKLNVNQADNLVLIAFNINIHSQLNSYVLIAFNICFYNECISCGSILNSSTAYLVLVAHNICFGNECITCDSLNS